MIILVGVGHVFKIADKIKYLIHTVKPDAVAVELDAARLDMLMHRDDYEMDSSAPLGMRMMASIQEKIAKEYGVEVGSEMLAAVEAAREMSVPAILIDTAAMELINQMWNDMKFTEKAKFISGLLTTKIAPNLGSKGMSLEEALAEFDDDPDKFMEELEKHFPKIKKVLVDQRNETMAENLIKANTTFRHIVAVIGAGHISGIKKLLEEKGIEVEVIHLNELILEPERFLPAVQRIRNRVEKERMNREASTATFSFTYEYPDG